ncbi:hypothetical protein ElyMa_002918400 [Elysia marginata]|uniref:Uncharacterized protein n=1 Tax=Elysia marginata TaxID=1093978 RepID=A0AAV4I3E2_9GAST|nr:hypothetical protein ElyMa_002918400 [Elysia marginata]
MQKNDGDTLTGNNRRAFAEEVETFGDNSSMAASYKTDCGGESLDSFPPLQEKGLGREQDVRWSASHRSRGTGGSSANGYRSLKTDELGALLGADITSEVFHSNSVL